MLRGTRRVAGLAVALAVLLAPGSSSAGRLGTVSTAGGVQAALIAQVNALRAAHGLSQLRVSSRLTSAAVTHSTEMARLGYFSHSSANGASFSQRIAFFYPSRGYRRWTVGENLVWGSPSLGATRALKLWLGSPPHRANLLNPSWRELGLSAVHSTSAPGAYRGAPATIITADFGARSR